MCLAGIWFGCSTILPGQTPSFTEYAVETIGSYSYLTGITTGPDGALWFTEYFGNNIGRITTTGVINKYPVPAVSGLPLGITLGPDGALWFTEYGGNKIGRVSVEGIFKEYQVPTAR